MRNRRPYLNLRTGVLVITLATIPLVPLKLSPYLPNHQRDVPEAQSTIDAPDAEFEPIFTQTVSPPVDLAELFPYRNLEELAGIFPVYERVPCGDIDDDVCYEICTFDRCYIYGDDDGRVTRYKEMVDAVKELEDQLELLREQQIPAILDAAGDCFKAGAAAAAVKVALIAVAAPDVTWSKVVAVLAFAGAGLYCLSSVYSGWRVEATKQEQVRDKISDAYDDAVFEFQSLEESPP